MKIVRNVLIGSACLIGATNAFASESADLRVKGIISPAACTPAFSGIIDYGSIDPTTLNPDRPTVLPRKQISYTISCDAAVSFGTTWTDSRNDSVIGGHDSSFDDYVYGLGFQGTNKIGKYILMIDPSTSGDGNKVNVIYRPKAGGEWMNGNEFMGTKTIHAYATPGSLTPGSYTSIAGKLIVETYIAATETLDMSKTVELDGLATMSMYYL